MKKKWGKLLLIFLLVLGIAGCFRPMNVQAVSVKKAQDAVRAYHKFVTAKQYKKYTKTTKKIYILTDMVSEKAYNNLPDLNHDGVPELLLRNEKNDTIYIFSYRQKKVVYAGKISKKITPGSLTEFEFTETLMYHQTKRQMWTVEMDMSKVIEIFSDMLEMDEDLENMDSNELANKLLQAIDVSVRESLYKISQSGKRISKVKSSELRIMPCEEGFLLKMNGKERLRCGIYINDKTLSQLDYNDDKMIFHSMRMDFCSPKSKKVLSCSVKLGGLSADKLLEMDFEKLMKKKNTSYYYGEEKLTRKQADKKLNEMMNFVTSMKAFSEEGISLITDNLTKENINMYFLPRPEKMRLNYSWVRLRVGKSSTPKVKFVIPADANKKFWMISDNEKIAKITKDGRIIGVKPGKTTVTVKSEMNDNLTLKIKVYVVK